MADEDLSQEKTEEPTPKRLEEARKQGQIARSKELNTAVLLIGGAAALSVWYEKIAASLASSMRSSFSLTRDDLFDPNRLTLHLAECFTSVFGTVLPLLIILTLLALIGPVMLGGWGFSTKAMMPKFDRLSPMKGLKRMFSANSLMELLKAIAKVVLVGSIAWACLQYFKFDLLSLDKMDVKQAMSSSSSTIGTVMILVSLCMLVIAAIDVPFQIQQHTKQLRMTLQQVKDEMKESEGRPEVKGRIRQLQREFSQARMMGDIPDADVVITNPTHFSVAIKYATEGGGAPIVVAKGCDLIAFKIREVAGANDVPIIEAAPLARSLYYTTDIGYEIPDKLYKSVAQVLAYIFQLKQVSSHVKPVLGEIDIPDDMIFD